MSARVLAFPAKRASGVERLAAHIGTLFGEARALEFRASVRACSRVDEAPSRVMADRVDAMVAGGLERQARSMLQLTMALVEVRA